MIQGMAILPLGILPCVAFGIDPDKNARVVQIGRVFKTIVQATVPTEVYGG